MSLSPESSNDQPEFLENEFTKIWTGGKMFVCYTAT